MDHHVHRLMFYKLEPNHIINIVFNRKYILLAVLRNDNRIEIWNMLGTPFIQSTIFLEEDTKLRSLVWCDKRLFGADISGCVKELDLITLKEKTSFVVDAGGCCHCLAINPSETHLAVGTEDGFINIFKVKKNGLSILKLIQSDKQRIISISWDPRGEYLVTSGVEFIRMYHVSKQELIHNLKPSSMKLQRKKKLVVWSVVLASDLTIFAGDSSGFLSIWDGKMGVCLASFHSHIADILTVCLSDDEKTVYCAGIDPIIKLFTNVKTSVGEFKWVKSMDCRCHTHDVNSLAVLDDGRLCSGGVDSYLMVTQTTPFRSVIYPPLLQGPSVHTSKSRCIMLRYLKQLDFWLLKPLTTDEMSAKPDSEPFIKLVELISYNNEAIRCASMSDDGEWVAYATNNSLRVFRFLVIDGKPALKPVAINNTPLDSIRHIHFSGNNQFLCIANSLTFQSIYLSQSPSSLKFLESPEDLSQDKSWPENSIITLMAVSTDGNLVAVSNEYGQVSVWSTTRVRSLPKYYSSATAISFRPNSDELVVIYSDYKLIEYSVESHHYTQFSKCFDSNLIDKYLGQYSLPVLKLSFDENNTKIVLHNSSVLCTINKDRVVGSPKQENKKIKLDTKINDNRSPKKRSKKFFGSVNLQSLFDEVNAKFSNDLSTDEGIHAYEKYQHLLHFESIGGKEMIAIEVKPKSFMNKLPPLLKKNLFGRK